MFRDDGRALLAKDARDGFYRHGSYDMRASHQLIGIAIAALFLVLPGAAALADAADDEARRISFEAADRDGDGRLDEAEIAADTAAAFAVQDANGDSRLELEEIQVIGSDRFNSIDQDGDGKLTFKEVMEVKLEDIEEADTDKDGVLSLDEVNQFKEVR